MKVKERDGLKGPNENNRTACLTFDNTYTLSTEVINTWRAVFRQGLDLLEMAGR